MALTVRVPRQMMERIEMTERKLGRGGSASGAGAKDAARPEYDPEAMAKPTLRMEAIQIPLEAYRDDMLLPVADDEVDSGPVLRARVSRISDPPPAGPASEPPATARVGGRPAEASSPDLDPLELDPLDWSED